MIWTFQGKEITPEDIEGYCGFVYLITNTTNGRKYIGKKLLRFSRKKKVKGRTRRVTITSDWLKYFGSNDELNEDVKNLGAEHFTREILRFCRSKTEMSYFEAYEQFVRGALLTDEYYNTWILCKVRKTRALSEAVNE